MLLKLIYSVTVAVQSKSNLTETGVVRTARRLSVRLLLRCFKCYYNYDLRMSDIIKRYTSVSSEGRHYRIIHIQTRNKHQINNIDFVFMKH